MTCKITGREIADALQELKLPRGVPLLVHSSLRSLGAPLQDGAAGLVRQLTERLGPQGTLVLPTLSFSSVDEAAPVFDARRTPSDCGALSEWVRQQPGVFRSCHVVSSAAAIGWQAAAFTSGHLDTPCGGDTPYGRVISEGGAVLFLGTGFGCNTLFHAAEEAESKPYLCYASIRNADITDCTGRRFIHTFRRYNCYQTGIQRYLEKMGPVFEEAGVLRRARLGNAVLTLIDAEKNFELCRRTLREHEEYLRNP